MLYSLRSVGYFDADSDYYVQRQGLDAMLVIYTFGGCGYLEYRGKNYSILPGQVFVIDCDEYQEYGAREEGWQFFWAHFKGAESRSIVQSVLRTGGPVYRTEDQTEFFNELFIRADNPCAKSNLLISERIYSLLIQLMLQAGESRSLSEPVELAVNHIEMHFSQEMTLDDIAQAARMSKYHLAREFKKQLNQSPYDYLLRLRLRKAKFFLLTTDDSVAQIAEKCGFGNLSGFFRQFRQMENCSPLQYRKKESASIPVEGKEK